MTAASNEPLQIEPVQGGGPPVYRVGQDGEGRWIAMESRGLAGGIFRTHRDAVRFACIETGCRPDDVASAAGPIRFRLT